MLKVHLSTFSFKMPQFMLIMLLFCPLCCTIQYDGAPLEIIDKCMRENKCHVISIDYICLHKATMNDPKCTMDISGFSQMDFSYLLKKVEVLEPWIMCNGSALSQIDFSNNEVGHAVLSEGHERIPERIPLEDYPPTLTVVNNLNLRTVRLNENLRDLEPGLLKIRNNPRLSRLSIDHLRSILAIDREIQNKADIQPYGECDFHTYMSPQKDSLSWEEFRWCRTVMHDVALEGSQFNSTIVDAAYVLDIKGTLTIRNTKLTNLRMLPVYFKMNGGVIANNPDLCISIEDEIRMKRLGFTMQNNKPLDCRTTCAGGKLSLEEIKSLKNCITIKGGLELDNIDGATAAADFFKTVKTIEGPLIIRNATVPVVFKKLATIEVELTNGQSHILIENCKHPVVFNKPVKLEGQSTSQYMVVLNNARTNRYRHLKAEYGDGVYDSVRDQPKRTTATSTPVTSDSLEVTTEIIQPEETTASTPVPMPDSTPAEKPKGTTPTPETETPQGTTPTPETATPRGTTPTPVAMPDSTPAEKPKGTTPTPETETPQGTTPTPVAMPDSTPAEKPKGTTPTPETETPQGTTPTPVAMPVATKTEKSQGTTPTPVAMSVATKTEKPQGTTPTPVAIPVTTKTETPQGTTPTAVAMPVATKTEKPQGTTPTPVAMPVATKTETPQGTTPTPVAIPVTTKTETSQGTTPTAVAMPVATKTEKPQGTTPTPVAMSASTTTDKPLGTTPTPVAMSASTTADKSERKTKQNVHPVEPISSVERRSSRVPSSTNPPPRQNAAAISDTSSSSKGINNSSLDDKKTVLMVIASVSFVVFLKHRII